MAVSRRVWKKKKKKRATPQQDLHRHVGAAIAAGILGNATSNRLLIIRDQDLITLFRLRRNLEAAACRVQEDGQLTVSRSDWVRLTPDMGIPETLTGPIRVENVVRVRDGYLLECEGPASYWTEHKPRIVILDGRAILQGSVEVQRLVLPSQLVGNPMLEHLLSSLADHVDDLLGQSETYREKVLYSGPVPEKSLVLEQLAICFVRQKPAAVN